MNITLGAMKCHVCKKVKKGFVGSNRMFYCGTIDDPKGCFQKDVQGRLTEKPKKQWKKKGKKSGDFGLPRYLQPKTVHTSTVGVGGK